MPCGWLILRRARLGGGGAYVAFVIDTFVRRILGWRESRTAHASFVPDALEQALYERQPAAGSGLIHDAAYRLWGASRKGWRVEGVFPICAGWGAMI